MSKLLTESELANIYQLYFGSKHMHELFSHIEALAEQKARWVELAKQCGNEADRLQAGLGRRDAQQVQPVGYFAYSEDGGYEEFTTQDEAIRCANGDINTARGDSCDGWPDGVNSIVWGVVMHRATQTGLRQKDDDDNVAPYITEVCDYELLPAVDASPPSPAVPDAMLTLTDEQIDAVLDSHGNMTYVIADKRERLRLFAREILRAAMLAKQPVSAVPAILSPIMAEIERAMRKFPTWPTDPIHASKILDEEVGELSKAVLQATYEPHKSGPQEVKSEAIQAAAMAIRFIASLDKYQYVPSAQHEQENLFANRASGDKEVSHD